MRFRDGEGQRQALPDSVHAGQRLGWPIAFAPAKRAGTQPQETLMRPSGRAPDQMRPISIETSFTIHAEGSVLVAFGNTKVLVTASVEEKVPPFLRGKGRDRKSTRLNSSH